MTSRPVADKIVEDNFTTDKLRGSAGNDYLIHHRDLSVDVHSGTGMIAYAGDDTLEGSVPKIGQIHMMASEGDDWMILDTTKVADAIGMQGHHAYGGPGEDTFQFTNISANASPIVGRLDDYDPTSDRILIEDTEINLDDLPTSIDLPNGDKVDVRVIEVEHPEFDAEDLGTQHFLAIGDNIFYALEGARDLQNGTSGMTGEERHFLGPDALDTLRSAEAVEYENPTNFVPHDFYKHREEELYLDRKQSGAELSAETGDKTAAHMFGGKSNSEAHSSAGEQRMIGSSGDDVIDANTGNDTVSGADGDDLIATGIDNDLAYGGSGDDMIWGGDGDDTLNGSSGNDFLHGGRGDDLLFGGQGHDTIFSGEGNNTLVGGGEDAINRFHFYEDGGDDTIADFKVGLDLITLQDDIDPLSVELYEDKDGNTVLNYAESGSVQLKDVALKDFQEAAVIREEDENPIITITADPEEEMLRELRIENGFYGNDAPPSLMVEGLLYGNAAFVDAGPGGYAYVSDEEMKSEPGPGKTTGETASETEFKPPSEIPTVEEEEEEDDEHEREEDEDDGSGASCFVATAAYRDPWHPDVKYLRAFRDQWLVHRAWGRAFVAFYWRVGPRMAGPVRRHAWLGHAAKIFIAGLVRLLQSAWVSKQVKPSSYSR